MAANGLLFGALVSVIQASAFLWVGRVLSDRKLEGPDRRANNLFILWWYSLSGVIYVAAAINVAAAFGYTDLALHVALLQVLVIVLLIGLWGLAFYFVYLFTGSSKSLVPLALFYGAVLLMFLYLVMWGEPDRVDIGPWRSEVHYRHDFSETMIGQAMGILLIAPILLGALGYLSLFFKLDLPILRYRIALVGGSILVWFGTSIVAGQLGVNEEPWWIFVSNLISITAAFIVVMAYRPPQWIVRRLDQAEAPMEHAGARSG